MTEPKTFLFAGASSRMATETASLLKKKGHRVIGISIKDHESVYDTVHRVEAYTSENFPALEQPLDGIAYFPGTINLKPFAR